MHKTTTPQKCAKQGACCVCIFTDKPLVNNNKLSKYLKNAQNYCHPEMRKTEGHILHVEIAKFYCWLGMQLVFVKKKPVAFLLFIFVLTTPLSNFLSGNAQIVQRADPLTIWLSGSVRTV